MQMMRDFFIRLCVDGEVICVSAISSHKRQFKFVENRRFEIFAVPSR
jgi:hypothetical protein